MVRWFSSTAKIAVALGALAALLVSSGAGLRWGELDSLLTSLF
jgi:hypothetical protein